MSREHVSCESLRALVTYSHHILGPHFDLKLNLFKAGSLSVHGIHDAPLAEVNLIKGVAGLKRLDAGHALSVIFVDIIQLWRDVDIEQGLEHTMGANVCFGLGVLRHAGAAFVIFDLFFFSQ